MSKYQLKCSCVYCRTETTTQSLKSHIAKCTAIPINACKHCGKPTNNAKFCSASCRATVTNALRPKKTKPLKISKAEIHWNRFLLGEVTERPSLRKHLSALRGYRCETCGLSDWNGEPITLIVDHKNGDAGNNHPDNLQLLCPNCNSQTDTFAGRNKGSGRKSRGLPLH